MHVHKHYTPCRSKGGTSSKLNKRFKSNTRGSAFLRRQICMTILEWSLKVWPYSFVELKTLCATISKRILFTLGLNRSLISYLISTQCNFTNIIHHIPALPSSSRFKEILQLKHHGKCILEKTICITVPEWSLKVQMDPVIFCCNHWIGNILSADCQILFTLESKRSLNSQVDFNSEHMIY